MATAKNTTAAAKPETAKPETAKTDKQAVVEKPAAPAKAEKPKTVFVTNGQPGPRGFYGDDGIETMLDPRQTVELELSPEKQKQLKDHGFKVSATKPKTQADVDAEEAAADADAE